MCGLVGFCSTTNASDNEIALLKNLLAADIVRGAHATGLAKVDPIKNEVSIHKMAVDAYDFLAHADTKKFLTENRARIYIGHNRYATMGDKGDHENAHPFQVDHITMVHNGTVDAWGIDLLEGSDTLKVDSHMVAATIAKHGIRSTLEERFSGAAALVWWDAKERSLNFVRNSERPLFFAVTTTGTIVWASEDWMLKSFLERASSKIKLRGNIVELSEETLVSIPFTEAGVRKGVEPISSPVTFLDLPIPESYRQAEKFWGNYVGAEAWKQYLGDYYDDQGSKGSQAGTQAGQKASSSRAASDEAYARNTLRINNNLRAAGSYRKQHSLLTFRIIEVQPYKADPGFGTVVGIDLDEGMVVEAYGLNVEALEGYTTLRGSISNAYFIGEDRDFKVVVEGVAVSCLDPKHKASPVDGTPLQTIGTRISPSKVLQMKSEAGNTPPANISYPLKCQGHTFVNSYVFQDFVCRGCAVCGDIPTAYDQRNRDLTVYEGSKFTGELNECEFVCGKCVREGLSEAV
ncbi:hypothetical protein Epa1_p45 [Pseudomonas phage Epa1]|uniref:Glutamine amidotransferase type-2 domain-containing protein n=1 Tax=Pseudomonas phage Epa1 TaxID=2719568 RepID=A0A6G9LIC6_9CAUD|nr:hypothetical protein Epa1_p45 [Pseudomonas phage Epa1]